MKKGIRRFWVVFLFLFLLPFAHSGGLMNISEALTTGMYINLSDTPYTIFGSDTSPNGYLWIEQDDFKAYVGTANQTTHAANTIATVSPYLGTNQFNIIDLKQNAQVLVEFWFDDPIVLQNTTNISIWGSSRGASSKTGNIAFISLSNNECLLVHDGVGACGMDATYCHGMTKSNVDCDYGIGTYPNKNENQLLKNCGPASIPDAWFENLTKTIDKIAFCMKGGTSVTNHSLNNITFYNLQNGTNDLPTVSLDDNGTALCFNSTTSQAEYIFDLSVNDSENDDIYYATGNTAYHNRTYVYYEDFMKDGLPDYSMFNQSIFWDYATFNYGLFVDYLLWGDAAYTLYQGSGSNLIHLPNTLDIDIQFIISMYFEDDPKENITISFRDQSQKNMFQFDVDLTATNVTMTVEGTEIFNEVKILDQNLVVFTVSGHMDFINGSAVMNTSSNYHTNIQTITDNTYNYTNLRYLQFAVKDTWDPLDRIWIDDIYIRGNYRYTELDWSLNQPQSPLIYNSSGKKYYRLYVSDGPHLNQNEYIEIVKQIDVKTSYCDLSNYKQKTPIKIGRGFLYDIIEEYNLTQYVWEALWFFLVVSIVGLILALRNVKISVFLSALATFIFSLLMAPLETIVIFGVILGGSVALLLA